MYFDGKIAIFQFFYIFNVFKEYIICRQSPIFRLFNANIISFISLFTFLTDIKLKLSKIHKNFANSSV